MNHSFQHLLQIMQNFCTTAFNRLSHAHLSKHRAQHLH